MAGGFGALLWAGGEASGHGSAGALGVGNAIGV
jgi:hypothetical protein